MDIQGRYEALKGEYEVEDAILLRSDGPAEEKFLRAFADGDAVRIDLLPSDGGDGDRLQILVSRDGLLRLLDRPQDLPSR